MITSNYDEKKMYPEAVTSIQKALSLDPNNPSLHRFYADALSGVSKWNKALDELEKAKKLGCPEAKLLLSKGLIYFRMKNYS
eukprot:CAMPEP_0114581256 /NCGR_PEP_ID=MMETSP0125-20121206/5393_1 /TAXON_ID=485358 ORGANISM="Aristerostoma sp., Strain ATCC 50986" /NCGR_SAMPLE_ID=MMETSP0125 /ASSEMBLY_ACC=CAM_ASM_000245 /LENGTH=81 /DNA_ID=CAMNT_0001773339 /DNA_START=1090 /DNA_END=1335 /DNA_ORIENTATION=+